MLNSKKVLDKIVENEYNELIKNWISTKYNLIHLDRKKKLNSKKFLTSSKSSSIMNL